jgi:HD-GYP domain-containing protein (c-di-GMP phosphodiesterase class II)
MREREATKLFHISVEELSPHHRYGTALEKVPDFMSRMLAAFIQIMSDADTNKMVMALRNYDKTTYIHSFDLFLLVGLFGLKGETTDIQFLRGALLHDIGKIGIPTKILSKNGRLTFEEYEIIQSHTIVGNKILDNIGMNYEAILARSHHERLDGSGYPDKLTDDKIGLDLRWLGILDVYSALTLERPYKRAFTNEEAGNILNEKTTQYDGELLGSLMSSFYDEKQKNTSK